MIYKGRFLVSLKISPMYSPTTPIIEIVIPEVRNIDAITLVHPISKDVSAIFLTMMNTTTTNEKNEITSPHATISRRILFEKPIVVSRARKNNFPNE